MHSKILIKTITEAALTQFEEFDSTNDLGLDFERPNDDSHGNWSTNIAFRLANKLETTPRTAAEKLISKIDAIKQDYDVDNYVEKIEVAGPGFINFYISPIFFQNYVASSLSSEYVHNLKQLEDNEIDNLDGARIVVEMGDANTHKLPHIGHLFNYVTGDSIARMMIAAGAKVYRVSWQGDVGPHVAKCIYGWRKLGKQDPGGTVERMVELQKAYVEGSRAFDEDKDAQTEIRTINKQIYAHDPQVHQDWLATKLWSIEFDEYFENKLGIKLQNRYLEGDLWQKGLKIVKENIGNVFQESEGAIVFPGENFGLHTRVFITKEGTPTYEAKEFGLNTQKMKDFPYDLTIIPTGNEQNDYFRVVIKAISIAVPELKNKIEHIGTGMITLSSGKMSSRTGNILSGPDLVNRIESAVSELVSNREGINSEEKNDIVAKVTMAAVKYALLKSNIRQNSVFNLEESISFEGNSGPYLLYTYARIQSILSKDLGDISTSQDSINWQALVLDQEIALLEKIERFSESIHLAIIERAPHIIATYLYEIAQLFNKYYKGIQINHAGSDELIVARRALSRSVSEVIKMSLWLLGIETLDKM